VTYSFAKKKLPIRPAREPGFMNPQSFNRYSYVLNNPVKLIDPDGMMWVYHYLDTGHTRIGIAWIEGNKIPKNLKAQGYRAVNFQNSSAKTITLTNGSVVRLSANSSRGEVLRGPRESGGDSAYGNTKLVQELGRRTAPIPKAVAQFALISIAGGYTVASSPILLADAAAYALYALHEQGQNDDQVMASTSNVYQEVTKGGSIRNVQTDVTRSEFIKNLTDSGYKMTKSGEITILDNGASRYVIYDVSKSIGGPSAAFSKGGEGQSLKIRLKP
jgi:hypothetical protein